MAACAHDLLSARKPPSLTTAIKQLIDAETVERRVRSIQYQMRIAKFPHHKDFATFDYGAAAVTKAQVEPFCSGQFTEEAHNLILVGGTGTGKTQVSIAVPGLRPRGRQRSLSFDDVIVDRTRFPACREPGHSIGTNQAGSGSKTLRDPSIVS